MSPLSPLLPSPALVEPPSEHEHVAKNALGDPRRVDPPGVRHRHTPFFEFPHGEVFDPREGAGEQVEVFRMLKQRLVDPDAGDDARVRDQVALLARGRRPPNLVIGQTRFEFFFIWFGRKPLGPLAENDDIRFVCHAIVARTRVAKTFVFAVYGFCVF